jgi:hypothetical protein
MFLWKILFLLLQDFFNPFSMINDSKKHPRKYLNGQRNLSVCLSLSVHTSVSCPSVCLSDSLGLCVDVYLSLFVLLLICLPLQLSIRQSVCLLSVCLRSQSVCLYSKLSVCLLNSLCIILFPNAFSPCLSVCDDFLRYCYFISIKFYETY